MKWLVLCLLASLVSCSPTSPGPHLTSADREINRAFLDAVDSMPEGGGYDPSPAAVRRLAAGVTVTDGRLVQDLETTGPTFCSGATYLVFLRALERLGILTSLPPEVVTLLARIDVPDGHHFFGRWNANGPGTAKLFADLACGVNFTSFQHARPGDFLKLWWTGAIGAQERGHLVVFLSQTPRSITFWSANQPDGFGRKTVAKSRIKRHLFSRLTHPDRLARAPQLPSHDPFLAAMLHRDFRWEQVVELCRVRPSP